VTLEKTFQDAFLIAANAPGSGIRLDRQNAGKFRALRGNRIIQGARKGASDLIGLARGGLHLEVECKGPKTRTTKEQMNRERFVESWGGLYLQLRYDESLSLEDNVERGVGILKATIRRKRARDTELDYARDPMLAGYGDCQSPPAREL
jgi:hypothetical protein